MKYISAAALLLAAGCNVTVHHSPTCDMSEKSHVCPEKGHGPCPFCPSVKERSRIWYQAFDDGWEGDPSINPVFESKAEAEKYAKYNNMGNSHSYEVRVVNFRYQVRIINPSTNELLHNTDEYNDAYEYVVEYSSAHADLVIFDLKTGERFEETP